MRKGKLRIGIVGLGIGIGQASCFFEDERVEVVAVADRAQKLRAHTPVPNLPPSDGKTPAEYARSIGVKYYGDAVEMINSGEIDAISLAVRPRHRLPLLKAAATRKMPVLMEKPMSATLEEAVAMARIVRQSGIFFMMEYPMRYFPPLVELRKLIDNGVVGKVWVMTGVLQTTANPQPGSWIWDPADGNGPLNEGITHLYDTTNFLCGNPVEVYAAGRNFMGRGSLEDAGVVTVKYENGSVASLTGGGLGTFAMSPSTDSSALGAAAMALEPLCIHVYGENGEAMASGRTWLFKTLVHASRADKEPTIRKWEPPPRLQIMRYNLREFIRCILENQPTDCGIEAGLTAQCVVDALKASMASGKAVAVKSIESLLARSSI